MKVQWKRIRKGESEWNEIGWNVCVSLLILLLYPLCSSYLLGLLAKIKCSISSSRLNLRDWIQWILLYFLIKKYLFKPNNQFMGEIYPKKTREKLASFAFSFSLLMWPQFSLHFIHRWVCLIFIISHIAAGFLFGFHIISKTHKS